MVDKNAAEALWARFKVIPGFKEHDIDRRNLYDATEECWEMSLVSDDVIVKIDVYFGKSVSVCGHTDFKVGDMWFTFDRRGFEDSFYAPYGLTSLDKWDVETVVQEQVARAKKRIVERTAEGPVTQIMGFSVTAARLAEYKKQLKEKGSVMLRPAGMGVAYVLRPRRKYRWDTVVPEKEAAALGYRKLFAESVDWD